MQSKVIDRAIAQEEVTKWLDKKKIMPSIREDNEAAIELLIDSIEYGILELDTNNFKFKHKLLHPFGDEVKIEGLEYHARLNDRMLKPFMNGVKATDADGRLLGYIGALTGQNRGVLEAMDSADKKIAMAIAVFFL